MQLRSLPSYFRFDQSPMSASDSPFPPLKVEHRYRGVYERAGFDVNLASPTDSKSMNLKKSLSVTSPTFRNGSSRGASESPVEDGLARIYSSRNVTSPLPQLATALTHSAPPLSPKVAALQHANNSTPEIGRWNEQAQQPYNMNSHSTPSLTVTVAPAMGMPDKFQLPKRNQRSEQKQYPSQQQFQPFKPFQPVKTAPRLNKNVPQSMQEGDRNVKKLVLNIPNSNFSSSSVRNVTSTDSSSITESPTFEESGGYERLTPQTSASSSVEFTRKSSTASEISVKTSELTTDPYPLYDGFNSANKDLSEVLDDFKSDVEGHKKYDPRSRGPRSADIIKRAETRRPSYLNNPSSFEDSIESSQDDMSFRFNSARQSDETNDTVSEEFDNFLQTASKPGNNARNSQLSTISSIISKAERSEDEDSEVERELERQLKDLKKGSELSISFIKPSKDEDSFVTALNALSDFADCSLPSFKIDDASQILDHDNSDSNTGTESDSKELVKDVQEDDDLNFGDQVAPLSFHKNIQPRDLAGYPRTPVVRAGEFEDQIETPETIKPLSPKNHCVEEELKNINFKGAYSPQFNENILGSLASDSGRNLDDDHVKVRDDVILLQNPAPSEFDAFPKSVVGMEVPDFRTSMVGPKNAPGEGPCRVCNNEIEKNARGGQKSIYSKNAELSGQWHRDCFSCAYVGCNVKFNKHVSCYVLLDNAFCHDHYHTLNGTRCQSCRLGIEGDCIENEMKQKWHVHCLKCSKCNSGIISDYFLINNEIYCEDDASKEIKNMERNGLSTTDKVAKRRTRILFLDQQHAM